jgi:hypothetical protein
VVLLLADVYSTCSSAGCNQTSESAWPNRTGDDSETIRLSVQFQPLSTQSTRQPGSCGRDRRPSRPSTWRAIRHWQVPRPESPWGRGLSVADFRHSVAVALSVPDSLPCAGPLGRGEAACEPVAVRFLRPAARASDSSSHARQRVGGWRRRPARRSASVAWGVAPALATRRHSRAGRRLLPAEARVGCCSFTRRQNPDAPAKKEGCVSL